MVGVGSTVGNYAVLAKIGEGAMGTVWLARHPQIGKRVALKVIRPELTNDEEVLTRFFNEARAVTLIGHPNIVDVQDFGQTPGGDSFIVMELLEGQTLAQAIRGGEMPIERILHIVTQLADGLQAAHVRGILHRDLKPDNVFLTVRADGTEQVKILDFGLAKLTGPGALQHKTRTGTVLGTAHYMAPESAEGTRHADHRADIYGLGCILYELVTRSVPFPGEGFGEVLVRHLRDAPNPPSRLRGDVPPWLDKLVLHALAKKAEHRFQSMEAFGAALRDPLGWDRGVNSDEIALRSRIVVAPTPAPTPRMTPVRITPTPTVAYEAPARRTPSPSPSPVVRAAPSQEASTRISEAEPPKRKEQLLPAILVSIAILGVASALVVWIQRKPEVVPTKPVVTAPTPMVPEPLAPVATFDMSVVAAPVVAAPVPAKPVVAAPVVAAPVAAKPVRRPARPHTPKPTPIQRDGALLVPTF